MADIKTPEERSKNMAAIKGKDTKPEVYLRKKLFAEGYRFRKNSTKVCGHPDIWLRKYNTAIFVHGCFWHRHEGCKYAYMPKSRTDFWNQKFQNNIKRDQTVISDLKSSGIRCMIIWECTIKKMKRSEETSADILKQIENFFQSDSMFLEI